MSDLPPEEIPPGKEEVNYKTFVNSLKEIGYGGFLSQEICTPVPGGENEENLNKWVRDSLKYIRNLSG